MPPIFVHPDDPDLAGARLAASVVVLRDGDDGPEVLMLRRAEREADLRSGVWVFPGGVLDPVDARLHGRCLGEDDATHSARLGLRSGGLDFAVAALRECFEEVGLLFAQGPGLQAALAERAAVQRGEDFVALCERHGLALSTQVLRYHSHWLTPPGIAKRFDTRFYVAQLPAGQTPVADQGEALEIAWLSPAEALSRERALKLLPVTRRTLQDLGRFERVQDILDDAAARRQPPRMMPRMGRGAAGVRPVLPDEWAYAEIGRLDPQGRGDVCFELPPLQPVALSERVTRLTCANGSVMTGPGTNTYLIGAPGGALAVLDPGPDDGDSEAHLQAVLAAAAGRPITRILVTHTHKDHSPAAQRLRALTGAALVGLAAVHPEWQDTAFVPDHAPADGERLLLGPGCTLRAVHTPGHAANHVCWLLEEEALLFTGDHVMQGSTVVINPPDGDMAAYLRALSRLLELPLSWFAPGHGFLMAQPHEELRRLIAHRLAREDKVLAAVQALGPCADAALVPTVYGDVPAARHGIALRSLRAHLHKLQAEGRVREAGGLFSA